MDELDGNIFIIKGPSAYECRRTYERRRAAGGKLDEDFGRRQPTIQRFDACRGCHWDEIERSKSHGILNKIRVERGSNEPYDAVKKEGRPNRVSNLIRARVWNNV